jgi:uncharacterized protein (DUF1778 family)
MPIESRAEDTRAGANPEDEVTFAEERRAPLSARDYDRLVDLLENPPEPTEALRRAFAKYGKHRR